jgi:hypothetical protein
MIFPVGPSGISSTTANALSEPTSSGQHSGSWRTAAARPRRREPGRFNKRVDQILGHVTAVLPQFALACLVLAALPGPATALFLHRTVRDGRAGGLAAVAGNEIDVFCWALAAGAGLTELLRANRLLFAVRALRRG